MKQLFLFTFFLFAFTFSGKAQDTATLVNVDDTMPAFTIISDNGQKISSDNFKGKVILITLFATWCPPCQQELAEIENVLWPQYKDNDDFVLLVIGREHSDADLAKYNEKKGFTFPLYPDKSREIYNAFATQFIPRSYLIGKDGKVVFKTQGFAEKDFKRLLRTIDNALML